MTISPDMYIRFTSHRARSRGLRRLEYLQHPKPGAYWSLTRASHPGGIYRVTAAEADVMRQAGARFTRLRGPFEDLRPCWTGEYAARQAGS